MIMHLTLLDRLGGCTESSPFRVDSTMAKEIISQDYLPGVHENTTFVVYELCDQKNL